MEFYRLKKPDTSTVDKKRLVDFLQNNKRKVMSAIYEVSEPKYLFWDKIRHKLSPHGLRPIEFWYLIKLIRTASSRPTILRAESGEYFHWLRLIYTDEYLHKMDLKLGGELFLHYQNIITTHGKQRLLTKSLIEEAIASSQLEGAITTTPAAKKMILEKRVPKDKSERMIVNNYKTMKAINEHYKSLKLSEEILFELHSLITKDTLSKDKQQRYRRDKDNITVNDGVRYIYHIPPKNHFVKREMKRLIKFANDEQGGRFIHPVIKAIFLHFWIGYLHPFYDGNGRLARTIFYWYLLRKKYWAIQYLPVSLAIKKSASQYGMAYVYTEQDDFDLTYFYDFHMRKILQSLKEFDNYIRKKVLDNKDIEKKIEEKFQLNDRQKELLRYLLVKGRNSYVTPSSYVTLYKISRMTAFKDFKNMEKLGLLTSKKVGRNMKYFATSKIRNLIKI